MIDDRDLLERELHRFEPPPGLTERVYRRRDRNQRNRRIRAGVLGLAIAIGVGWLGVNAIRSTSLIPAGEPDSAPVDGVPATPENGAVVPDRYSIVDGEVTFAATDPPWRFEEWAGGLSRTTITLQIDGPYSSGGIKVFADPLPVGTGCQADAAAVDAEALAARILSDPDIEATEPVPVRIAGVEALQMDVAAAPGASACADRGNEPLLFTSDEPSPYTDTGLWNSHSHRLYLLDVPEGSSRILAIDIFVFDRDFERAVEVPRPVLDSFEFHAP